jgi:ABC-type proline/glycine betaine transport system permease subunit
MNIIYNIIKNIFIIITNVIHCVNLCHGISFMITKYYPMSLYIILYCIYVWKNTVKTFSIVLHCLIDYGIGLLFHII